MYIDSHCHLDFSVFDSDREQIVASCLKRGVGHFIIPGTQFNAWNKQALLLDDYSTLSMAYGIHPYFLEQEKLSSIELLGDFCELNSAIAVGEIGLDIWPTSLPLEIQLVFFRSQLDVAKALTLPIILHARRSYDLLYKELKNSRFMNGGVVHGFSGSMVQAKRFIELGFVLGIGGNITYTRALKSIKVVRELGSEDYVLETDSPDMPIAGQQGERNTPLNIPLIAHAIAEIRQQSLQDIEYHTSININRVFPNMMRGSRVES
ncbi:TatD family hydrolase [Marinomonas sp. 15G1-11]|uniref:TatD family hydrolase n=1 Tax=Marinomonas phaeophyticola TaxID=3004091 RepID=A0ABT4JYD9_9GAMM|nr:TatD family hydrolase [Marinomonas sp. 15G1-11]MCZ2723240.1 TatD family hydrolase [Marinomonas sp. 15G1-11]